ncbi:hypothetical protein BROOK1789B_1764 [Bathymodiolus brooksi thiotrophic gill symbiont]|nr:hypothetical protein BROOK1789B_1764 [Bathymodiolus brooksi thiotrophic gill symbiont]
MFLGGVQGSFYWGFCYFKTIDLIDIFSYFSIFSTSKFCKKVLIYP